MLFLKLVHKLLGPSAQANVSCFCFYSVFYHLFAAEFKKKNIPRLLNSGNSIHYFKKSETPIVTVPPSTVTIEASNCHGSAFNRGNRVPLLPRLRILNRGNRSSIATVPP